MLNLGFGMVIGALFLLVVGVSLFYIWKVPSLISEMSGKTSRRNIKKLQKVNSGDSEVTNTDLINELSTGSFEQYGNQKRPSSGRLDNFLDHIPEEQESTGRFNLKRFSTTGSLSETGGIGSVDESTGGLGVGILTREQEVDNSVSLDYSEDVSTGYLGEDDDILGENIVTGAFSSTRTVVITAEYTSLN